MSGLRPEQRAEFGTEDSGSRKSSEVKADATPSTATRGFMSREEIAALIREEFDPTPRHWKAGEKGWDDGADTIADRIVNEFERLEKERFKYETCLMLISEGYPGAAELAKAAIAKAERAP
jgi:hypothetical protein